MLIRIAQALDAHLLAEIGAEIAKATWEDGASTAGANSPRVKRNMQIPPASETSRRLGSRVLSALLVNTSFLAATTPRHIFPPMFNRYRAGDHFDPHVDNAVRGDATTGMRIRVDIAATLFLSDPGDYDGGELVVDDIYGSRQFKPAAGDLVLYSAGSLHMVTPVTRGERHAAFLWIQSMIRNEEARALVHDLDTAIQHLAPRFEADDPDMHKLAGVYHNLTRYWVDA